MSGIQTLATMESVYMVDLYEAEIKTLSEKLGWDAKAVIRQIFYNGVHDVQAFAEQCEARL